MKLSYRNQCKLLFYILFISISWGIKITNKIEEKIFSSHFVDMHYAYIITDSNNYQISINSPSVICLRKRLYGNALVNDSLNLAKVIQFQYLHILSLRVQASLDSLQTNRTLLDLETTVRT